MDTDMSRDVCPGCAAQIDKRLTKMEADIAEFKALASKIWGFVEQMKDNPMLSAMLGGLPRK